MPTIYAPKKKDRMRIPQINRIFKTEIIGISKYLKNYESKFLKLINEHEINKPSTIFNIKKEKNYLDSRERE